jgi:hypothetical protein
MLLRRVLKIRHLDSQIRAFLIHFGATCHSASGGAFGYDFIVVLRGTFQSLGFNASTLLARPRPDGLRYG